MITEAQTARETIINTAKEMMAAARTAPKARGLDPVYIAMCEEPEIKIIAEKMREIAVTFNQTFFARDAACIENLPAVVLIGTELKQMELEVCGLCGHKNCATKREYPEVPCAFNMTDLGIAIGSAVSVAAAKHIDNRVMYSAGMAARACGLLPDHVHVAFAIPLSISSKNPFFDRK